MQATKEGNPECVIKFSSQDAESSPLLRLPGELREQILMNVFGKQRIHILHVLVKPEETNKAQWKWRGPYNGPSKLPSGYHHRICRAATNGDKCISEQAISASSPEDVDYDWYRQTCRMWQKTRQISTSGKTVGQKLGWSQINLSILRASFQLYKEANHLLWKNTTFAFTDRNSLKAFLQGLNEFQKRSLQHLELSTIQTDLEWDLLQPLSASAPPAPLNAMAIPSPAKMPLTVLSDSEIHALLITLNKDDILHLQTNLGEALHDYSTGSQETTAGCSGNNPKRLAIAAPNDHTTLFMPASTSTSRGIKIVSIATPTNPPHVPSMSSLSLHKSKTGSPNGSRSGSRSSSPAPNGHPSRESSIASTNPSLNSTSSSSHPTNNTTPNTSTTGLAHSTSYTRSLHSVKSNTSTTSSPTSTAAHGSLTLLTSSGLPYAFLAAQELTAFRTALLATKIFQIRDRVHSITVFGAGRQAWWHIRLALLLRGPEIHHIDIINRSFRRAKQLMHDFYTKDEWALIRDGGYAHPKLQFSVLSTEYKEYEQHLSSHVHKADAIFMCTPSTTPLFPAEVLTSAEGRRKGRYISAIGSYRPFMCELHPEILRQAVKKEHKHHHHRHAEKGGVIIVDSLEASLREAGEIIQAGIEPAQLVEVGELLMVKKAAMQEVQLGIGEGEPGLKNWLVKGNVIFKVVGLGLMDICVGEDLVMMARERGLGVVVDGF